MYLFGHGNFIFIEEKSTNFHFSQEYGARKWRQDSRRTKRGLVSSATLATTLEGESKSVTCRIFQRFEYLNEERPKSVCVGGYRRIAKKKKIGKCYFVNRQGKSKGSAVGRRRHMMECRFLSSVEGRG